MREVEAREGRLAGILKVYKLEKDRLEDQHPLEHQEATSYIQKTLKPLLEEERIQFKTRDHSGKAERHIAYMNGLGNGYARVNKRGHIVIGTRELGEATGREWTLDQISSIRYLEAPISVEPSSGRKAKVCKADPTETVIEISPVYDSSDSLEPPLQAFEPDYQRRRDILDSVVDEMIRDFSAKRKKKEKRQLVRAAN